MLMVETVTMQRICVEESWFSRLYKGCSVAGIVVHNPGFTIVVKLTPTPIQIIPIYVQQRDIPVDSVTERQSELFQVVRG